MAEIAGIPALDEQIALAARGMNAVAHTLGGRVQVLANSLFVLRRRVPEMATELAAVEGDLDILRDASERLLAWADVHRLPVPRLVRVGDIIDASLSQISDPAQQLAIHIKGHHLCLALDDAQITAAIRELVRNGLQAAASARVTLGVTASEDQLAVTVDDDGPSRWPDPVETAFDPFFTTKGGSLGLGLGIARTVALGHGGSLSIVPRDNGTRVLFQVSSRNETQLRADHG